MLITPRLLPKYIKDLREELDALARSRHNYYFHNGDLAAPADFDVCQDAHCFYVRELLASHGYEDTSNGESFGGDR
jgi:hypothetical protein